MQTHHISIDPYSRAPLMVAMTAMTISSAPDTTKLSKELVERAAAGRHQDVDRLLKDGADTWIREPVHVQCQTRTVWHCLALFGSWSMILFGGWVLCNTSKCHFSKCAPLFPPSRIPKRHSMQMYPTCLWMFVKHVCSHFIFLDASVSDHNIPFNIPQLCVILCQLRIKIGQTTTATQHCLKRPWQVTPS